MIRRTDANGDIELKGNTYTTGLEAIKISVKQALKLFVKEYFLDRTLGIPYMEIVLVKAPNKVIVEALLRDHILKVKGIDKILNLEAKINNSDRTITINFVASTIVDENLTIENLNVGIG